MINHFTYNIFSAFIADIRNKIEDSAKSGDIRYFVTRNLNADTVAVTVLDEIRLLCIVCPRYSKVPSSDNQ